MRGIAALLLSGASLGLASAAFANGYDVYAAPLVWSPDGALLAAAVAERWPQDAVLVPGQLMLCDRYGQPLRVLAEGAVGSPGFSQDGEVLAAVVDGDLWLFRATDGWAGAPVTDRGDVLDCAVGVPGPAGEGLRVYFSAGERFYGAELYAYDAAEAVTTPLIETGPDSSAFAPLSLPPSGSPLCFLFQPGFEGDWAYERLMLADETDPEGRPAASRQRRPWDYHESNVVPLNDGTVLFQRGGWANWSLIRLELATGRETVELARAQQPSVSADGRWLACARPDPVQEAVTEVVPEAPLTIWVFNRRTHALDRIGEPGVQAAFPALSPDGRRLAWLVEDGGAVGLVVRGRAGLAPRR